METGTLEKKIAKLPDELKVEGYVDALMDMEAQNIEIESPTETLKLSRSPKPVYGSGGGLIAFMADDFDAPLKEFHDYMYHISIEFIEKIEKLPLSMQQELEEIVNTMSEKVAK
jgi:hypothetical protein